MENSTNPIEIVDWKGLLAYTKLLSNGDETKVRICFIDEENDEIRLENEEDFCANVQFARDRDESNLMLNIYIDEKFVFRGVYPIKKALKFPREKLESLMETVFAAPCFIPVKQDEPLALCLSAAILLATEGQLESNADCEKFVQTVLPEAFRKLQTTPPVEIWSREIQCGIFEMLEFLVDLVAIRIRRPPVPITLLDVLGLSFDTTTKFSQKHQNETLPIRRSYQLIEKDFLRVERFGWLRSLLQRFLAQDALNYLRLQFEYVDSANSSRAATEYNVLLKLFLHCHVCINPQRFRLAFSRPIRQAIDYLGRQTRTNETSALNETLIALCRNYHLENEYERLMAFPFNALLIDFDTPRKHKSLVEKIRSMTMENFDDDDELQVKNVKKQRTEGRMAPLFTRQQLIDSIRELSLEKQRRSTSLKTEAKSIPLNLPSDQSDPDELLRHFALMRDNVRRLHDDLQLATTNGQLHDVIQIEEKLKLLNPYSARFIADANIPDGTIVKAGERFRKRWILLNDGSLPWDNEEIRLVNLINDIHCVEQPIVPITGPHTRTEITVDFISPSAVGVYESKWILAYRDQTFGPMFWCQIEVRARDDDNDVPLPACFDLSKPFPASRSIEDPVEQLSNDLHRVNVDNPQTVSLPSPPSPTRNEASRPMQTVMNTFATVAREAGSTAKTIFSTLRASEEPSRSSSLTNSDFVVSPVDPMKRLVEMGFANRAKNQRLLRENANDLAKVIELLTLDVTDDRDWFDHRH